MKLTRPELLVFAAAFVILSWNLWNVGIASGYIDPVQHFGAQDEATYTREAITMVREGGWMTPTFLGRWVFEKPPLLMWLSAISMKVFGIGRMPPRVPVVFAGALICALCFSMARRKRSLAAGIAAAAMALSSQILFIMARHNMTDILLACSGICAFAVVLQDPNLRTTRSFAAFVIAAAAGIMAKSIAGILVLAVMGAVVGLGQRRFARAALASALAIVAASPWFLYNFLAHREWFLADMGFQILTIGTAAHQTSPENHLWFYILRIVDSDLLPLLLASSAVPALALAVRRKEPAAWLVASYCILYFAALMVFHFHSEQYVCWFTPSLILIAAFYSPLLNGRIAVIAIVIICAVFFIKVANPDADFGISLRSGSALTAAPVLSRYCEEHRAADLYILGVDDEFYSAVLPLHHVRYGFVDAQDFVANEHPHLPYLGILVPAAEYSQIGRKLPVYRDRLRAWGLDSTFAVATGLSAHEVRDLVNLIADHPEADFLVARSILSEPERNTTHRVVLTTPEFSLLESKVPAATEPARWTCEM
jgi:4-amino-4-deoxy-L-arabinose transferase-like glycosyltransferase